VSPRGFGNGGALGGGGSILAVPALVYAAGQTPKHATTTSLVLVALTAMIGIVPHWRARRVWFVKNTIFGLAGIGGSLLGSHWNKAADPNVLLLAFSGLMMIAAYGMWRRVSNTPKVIAPLSVGAAAAPATAPSICIEPMTILKVIVAGSIVGLLTGFFGVGGGFVIVPALVLALGFTMPEAIGTSLLVITINSAVARPLVSSPAPSNGAPSSPSPSPACFGVIVGSRLASKHDSSSLQRWFVGLLMVVAIYTAARSGLALR
jgi:uncharacterized protein